MPQDQTPPSASRREVAGGHECETRYVDELPDPFPGEFRFVRLLGEGAFGKVWLAEDVHLGRPRP